MVCLSHINKDGARSGSFLELERARDLCGLRLRGGAVVGCVLSSNINDCSAVTSSTGEEHLSGARMFGGPCECGEFEVPAAVAASSFRNFKFKAALES